MKNILVIADPAETEQFAFQKALDMAKVTVCCYFLLRVNSSSKRTTCIL